jgi:hypothetical protein
MEKSPFLWKWMSLYEQIRKVDEAAGQYRTEGIEDNPPDCDVHQLQ